MPRLMLRLVAIAIAVAAFVDPAISMSGATRARLALVISQPSSPAERVRARLVQDLGASFEIVPAITSDAAAAIVIGDRYVDEPVPDALPIASVTIANAAAAGVRIVGVDAPAETPAATAIRVGVDVEGVGVAGRGSDVVVRIAGLEVGRASHRWTAARERWHAAIDALPVGEPPWVVRVEAAAIDGAGPGSAVDTLVDRRRSPFRVEVYEPRPSWATTFVRRALEADARFQVASLSYSSRGISARTRDDVRLDDPRLDRFDVVIVGGLDRLSASDGRWLDRYLRERGGAVVLLPDQRLDAGPARELVTGRARLGPDLVEQLLEQPAKLVVAPPAAAIEASELLVLRTLTPGSEIVASTPGVNGSPVIVSMPRGSGRLFVSGAMDAWRFRSADHDAFDRFWQSTMAGLALAVPPPMSVTVAPALLRPGGRGDMTVRLRSPHDTPDGAPVTATAPDGQPIRLTPAAEPGVFRGSFTVGQAPRPEVARAAQARLGDTDRARPREDGTRAWRVSAEAGGANPQSASRSVVVQADAHPLRSAIAPPLSMLSASHRGIDVGPERIPDLERFVRAAMQPPAATVVRHPMRSAWWMLPFAACLSAEWWLRRRRGLR